MSPMMLATMINPVADERTSQRHEPATYRCTTPSCTGNQWQVQCLSAHDQLWRVSSATDGSYLVAGVTPACPWCGADLAVDRESQTEPFLNGLLPSMNGSHQPGQTVNEYQWN